MIGQMYHKECIIFDKEMSIDEKDNNWRNYGVDYRVLFRS